VATAGDVRDQPKVVDAASEFPEDVFGKRSAPPVELEVIFEVAR
jgi:hypothetical protein